MRSAGQHFETRAGAELQRAGLKLLARNYPSRFGELDLVMLDGETLVFVEVRQRSHQGYGGALASISSGKRRRLARTAQDWLQKHPAYRHCGGRFDVIAFTGDGDDARMEWLRAAFDLDE